MVNIEELYSKAKQKACGNVTELLSRTNKEVRCDQLLEIAENCLYCDIVRSIDEYRNKVYMVEQMRKGRLFI